MFFVHGLVYAALSFGRSFENNRRSDRWLALFLLLCALYITPWMVGFAGWYDNQPYRDILFYTPFQQLFFIGPVTFFYVQSLLNPSFRFHRKMIWHLAPGLLYGVYCLVIVVVDKLILKEYYFLENGQDPDFDSWYQLAGMVSMLIYFLLSLRYYVVYRHIMLQVTSYADRLVFRWIKRFLWSILLMQFIRLAFFVTGFFVDVDYWGSWWQFFFFAIIMYYVAITGYSNLVEAKISFRPALLPHRPLILLDPSNAEDEIIEVEAELIPAAKPDEVLLELSRKIESLMKSERLYTDPELSLAQLASRLGCNAGLVSKTINQSFQLNFNDFINRFRVDAVKELILKGEHKKQTLLGLAFDAGFNSKATFNRAFKKFSGKSPKDFANDPISTGIRFQNMI